MNAQDSGQAPERVLVTGASSGFGAAIARRFVASGARVIAAARRLDRLEERADELGSDKLLALALDVRGYGRAARSPSGSIGCEGWLTATGRGAEAGPIGSATLGSTYVPGYNPNGVILAFRNVHSAIRANCNQIVTRETATHEYATIATWSRAD